MTSSPSRLKIQCVLVFAIAVLAAEHGGRAQTPDPLQYANGFLLTGNYVVGGVDLPKVGGAGTINFTAARGNTVPSGADIIAAYLYWETITKAAGPVADATFRGLPIQSAKASTLTALPGNGASCWGAAGGAGSRLVTFRADVLQMLPKQLDANGEWTGKYYVNDTDLLANGLPLHTVTLPQQGTGNVLTQSAGATLVLVYRDLSQPLRKVVLYDGPYAQPEGTRMTQVIRGFYGSSAARSARITHIVGSGATNPNERLFFNGVLAAANPFPAPIDASADRGWANPTIDVSPAMPGADANDGYGETVTTSVDHDGDSRPYECLSWAAIIFSTAVADVERDGIPDRLENAIGGLKDPPTRAQPQGQPLPNLHQMGASSAQRDLFVEINAMWAAAGTTYGSPAAPFNSKVDQIADPDGHNHLPTPEVLKLVGDAYAANGVTPHFDVGDLEAYYARSCAPGSAQCHVADGYLVASALARGGEAIRERACDPTGTIRCQFPDFPGTVGWRFGVQLYQDAPVGDLGEELDVSDMQTWSAGTRRRRFDRARSDVFHYVLYAHARGKARSPLPCLDAAGTPIGYDLTQPIKACTRNNPQFHVPASVSGIADLPGNTALITLGLWDDFLGTPFVQASTTLHELGHNLNLWHGGAPPIWGDRTRATSVEPNCKPNYLSAMSYLFQVHGLFDDAGDLHLDYSGTAFGDIGEGSLSDGILVPAFASSLASTRAYQPVWYTPLESPLATTIGASAATRFCSGAKFTPDAAPVPMARVRALSSWTPIDWNGDGHLDTSAPQDVNFDGRLNGALRGYNDWANVRLDQMGAVRKVRVYSNASGDFLDFGSGDFLDFGSGDFLDFGSGDFLDFGSGTYLVHFGAGDFLDFGSGDFLDFGSGDFLDFGSGVLLESSGDFLDFGSGDFLDFGSGDFLDFGSGDFLDFGAGDFLDFGAGDFLDFGSGNGSQELDYEAARELGRTAPSGLTACIAGQDTGCLAANAGTPLYHRVQLRWRPPTVGHVFAYHIYRVTGSTLTALSTSELVGTTSTMSFVDAEELPNGVAFTYFVKAEFDDETPHQISGASNFAVVTAVNDAPAAVDNSFSTYQGTALSVNVLDNDTDADSAPANIRALLVSQASHGTVVLNPNGSFTYTPNAAYEGSSDSFTYKANNVWRGNAASGDSNTATVSISLISRRTTTIVSSSLNPATYGEPLTFTASVIADSPILGTPAGTVTFMDGTSTLGSAALVNGTATFSPAALLSAGSHAIAAVYCGGPATMCGPFYGSTSMALTQIVNPAPVTATAGSGSAIYSGIAYSPSACVVSPIAPATYQGALTCSNNPATVGPAVGTYTIAPAVHANGETLSNFAITLVNGTYTILPPPNKPPVCTPFEATVKTGGAATLNHHCTDPDGDVVTVTAVGTATRGSTVLNGNGTFTYSIDSPTVGADSFSYTVSDGQATATGAVTMRVIYGFRNVQNLPPPDGKVFNRGSTIPLLWQWTNDAGTALDSAAAQPAVTAFACSTGGLFAGGYPLGTFTPDQPGSGNSFAYTANNLTWQFNWKLTYTATDARGRTNTYNLPAGTYVVKVRSALTGQIDPGQTYTCAGGQTVSGALITVVR